jgi:hypothetical protein
MRFPFEFAGPYRIAALPFGITPVTAWVDVGDDLVVRFGPWQLRTPVSNVAGTQTSGGYALVKTLGPPHLSFTDRGVTFATNSEHGLCVRFHEPVRVLWPLTHPGATMTVADVDGLRKALAQ